MQDSALLSRTYWFRLSEDDLTSLKTKSAALDVKPSTYLRTLCRLPVEVIGESDTHPGQHPGAYEVIVYNRLALARIHQELRRWGVHYDQSLKALRSITAADYLRPSEAALYMQKATALLGSIEDMRETLEGMLETLVARPGIGLR